MKKQLDFAVILLICSGYLFYSCTGGNSGNESKKDSTATSMSTDSISGSQNKKNLQHILSVADTITSYAKANFTKEDSLNYLAPYKSDVYPAIISGEDFYNAYQKIGVEDDDYIYISLNFSSIHKNPFKIFAYGVGASRIQTTTIHLNDFPYSVPLESAPGSDPPASQRLWVRSAILEKDSIDSFIANLKNDTNPINFEQDYSRYQIVIIPRVMTESKSGPPNQYIGLFLFIEKLGTHHSYLNDLVARASTVKQGTNPCPVCSP